MLIELIKNIPNYIYILIFIILFKLRFIQDSEIANFGFELFQLVYILFFIINTNNITIKKISLLIFFVHFYRIIFNFKSIINYHNKNKLWSKLSLLFLIFLLYTNYENNIPIIYSIIYSTLAINSFIITNTTLYTDIPITIGLLYLIINKDLYLTNKTIPLILGDFIYHIYELILYFK